LRSAPRRALCPPRAPRRHRGTSSAASVDKGTRGWDRVPVLVAREVVVQETTFYSDSSGVRITNARAVFGATTYSMATISSVALGVIPIGANIGANGYRLQATGYRLRATGYGKRPLFCRPGARSPKPVAP